MTEKYLTKPMEDGKYGINRWVKWLFLASSLIQVLYFVVWLLIQTDVVDHNELALSMIVHLSSRMVLTTCAAVLLLKSKIWQLKVNSWIVALNRVFVLIMVVPQVRDFHPQFYVVSQIAFYCVLVADLLALSSKSIRQSSLVPLLLLLLLDLVTLTLSITGIEFTDLLVFWLYSVLMALFTGLSLFFFYRRLENT